MYAGLRTMRQVRRARREFAAKHPRIQTSEDRAAKRRMEALAYVLFLAVVVIPGAVMVADALTGLHYTAGMLASVIGGTR